MGRKSSSETGLAGSLLTEGDARYLRESRRRVMKMADTLCRGRIPLAELARLPTFTYVRPSWARDKIAFYWDKTGRFELYVLDLVTRDLRRLTDGEAPRHLRAGFEWTRDDAAIVFAKDRDGDEQHNLWRIEIRTREVIQLNHDPKSQEYPGEVAPDNRRLAVISNRTGRLNLFILDLVSREWAPADEFQESGLRRRVEPVRGVAGLHDERVAGPAQPRRLPGAPRRLRDQEGAERPGGLERYPPGLAP